MNTPVEWSEADGAGASMANAYSDGHGVKAAAVASPKGKQPPAEGFSRVSE